MARSGKFVGFTRLCQCSYGLTQRPAEVIRRQQLAWSSKNSGAWENLALGHQMATLKLASVY
jgi:hypothetical protein